MSPRSVATVHASIVTRYPGARAVSLSLPHRPRGAGLLRTPLGRVGQRVSPPLQVPPGAGDPPLPPVHLGQAGLKLRECNLVTLRLRAERLLPTLDGGGPFVELLPLLPEVGFMMLQRRSLPLQRLFRGRDGGAGLSHLFLGLRDGRLVGV